MSSEAERFDPAARETARQWVVRLASREITPGDLNDFRIWHSASATHSQAFRCERDRWAALDRTREVFRASIAADARRVTRHHTLWKSLGGAVAAAFVLLVLSIYPFRRERADYATHVGQVESIDLQDGSRALLNSGTALDVAFGGPERRIRLLAGEAWFKVRHMEDRLFVVDAGGLEVVAKGTAFSVTRDSRETSVKVTEGVVVVRQGGSTLMELGAGRSAGFRAGERPDPVSFVEADALAWRERKIVLDGVTLDDAVGQIDRYRPGRVLVWGQSSRQRVSAILTLDRLDEGLDALAASQGRSVLHVTPWLAIVH